jgi:hypothetical protein
VSREADSAGSTPSSTELASSVSHRVNLIDLRTSRVLSELRRLPTRRPLSFEVNDEISCEQADDVLAYLVHVSLSVDEPEQDDVDRDDSEGDSALDLGPVFTADITLTVVYELAEGDELREGALHAFGELSVRHTAYPYLRELIHTLTMRGGLPPLVLGSFLAPVMQEEVMQDER